MLTESQYIRQGDRIFAHEQVRTVRRVITNPYHGWLGFDVGEECYERFYGWFSPSDKVSLHFHADGSSAGVDAGERATFPPYDC